MKTARNTVTLSAIACMAFASSACQQSTTNKTDLANSSGTTNTTDAPMVESASNATTTAPTMTEEERRAYMQRHGVGFAGTDANSDGRITMAEANAYARGPLTSGGDSDGDGAMSAAELARAHPDVRAMLLRRDANGDGAVSSAEIDARVEATFRAADTNRDGGITEQEWDAATAAAPPR